MSNARLSVPRPRTLERGLTTQELKSFTAIADILCGGISPSPSELASFPDLLHKAIALRSDAFHLVVSLLAGVPIEAGAQETWLRRLDRDRPKEFAVLSTVAAGAYLMAAEVRTAIGYPGQPRDRPGPEEAADDLLDLLGSRAQVMDSTG